MILPLWWLPLIRPIPKGEVWLVERKFPDLMAPIVAGGFRLLGTYAGKIRCGSLHAPFIIFSLLAQSRMTWRDLLQGETSLAYQLISDSSGH
jgi:hypothetical protein